MEEMDLKHVCDITVKVVCGGSGFEIVETTYHYDLWNSYCDAVCDSDCCYARGYDSD